MIWRYLSGLWRVTMPTQRERNGAIFTRRRISAMTCLPMDIGEHLCWQLLGQRRAYPLSFLVATLSPAFHEHLSSFILSNMLPYDTSHTDGQLLDLNALMVACYAQLHIMAFHIRSSVAWRLDINWGGVSEWFEQIRIYKHKDDAMSTNETAEIIQLVQTLWVLMTPASHDAT